MRASREDLFHVVFVLEACTDDAFTTAVLSLERVNREATDVAFLTERDDLFFFGNEVFVIAIVNSFANRRAAFIAILVNDSVELLKHDGNAAFALFQDVLQVSNCCNEFVVFGFQLFDIQADQLGKAHVNNCLRLDFVEREAILQALLCYFGRLALANNLHDFVDVLRCDSQTFNDVEASCSLLQIELRCTRNHIEAVVNVDLQKILERKELREVIDECQVINAKRRLELRVLEQVIQDNFTNCITAEFNHNADVTARFIADVRNAIDTLVADEVCNLLAEFGLVHHVRNFGDDDARFALCIRFNFGTGAHTHTAMTREVSFANARTATDNSACREVRALHIFHEVFASQVWIFSQSMDSGTDFAQVVRSHIRRHTYCNTRCSVHNHVRERRREHQRFFERFIVVRAHVDRLFFEIFEHKGAKVVHLRFGITHGSRAVTINRTEVSLTKHQRIAQREILRHTGKSIVNSNVTMRVVLTDNITHDTGGLDGSLVRNHAQLVHTIHHTTVHGLKAIARIRQCTSDNNAHRVAKIAVLHVLFDKTLELRSRYHFFRH